MPLEKIYNSKSPTAYHLHIGDANLLLVTHRKTTFKKLGDIIFQQSVCS